MTLQPQPVVKATPADSLAETFTPPPAMQLNETKHREAVDFDVPDFSHNAKSTIAPEPAVEAPIPEAKPKRPKPLETAIPPEVKEESQRPAQPQVREKTVPPLPNRIPHSPLRSAVKRTALLMRRYWRLSMRSRPSRKRHGLRPQLSL